MRSMLFVLLSLAAVSNSFAAGPYLFASIGYADIKSEMAIEDDEEWDKVKGDDAYTSVGFGFNIDDNISFEIAYNRFGDAKDDVYTDSCSVGQCGFDGTFRLMLEHEVTSVSLAVKGMIPVNSDVSIFGRLGAESWDGDYDFSVEETFNGSVVQNDSVDGSDDGTSFFYGVGISYSITKKISVAAQYEVHAFDSSDAIDEVEDFDVDMDVKVASITASFSF